MTDINQTHEPQAERRPLNTDELASRMTAPPSTGPAGGAAPSGDGDEPSARVPLFRDTADYRQRWDAVQTGFVDEPRRSVERADALVAEVIQQLVTSFADERNKLESQWGHGEEASTEDLRLALQRYRSFFDRLLSA